jgi:hypothetical protein
MLFAYIERHILGMILSDSVSDFSIAMVINFFLLTFFARQVKIGLIYVVVCPQNNQFFELYFCLYFFCKKHLFGKQNQTSQPNGFMK